MARPKRKIHYWVRVPGLFWCRARRDWVLPEEDLPKGGSNVRSFNTSRSAFRHAESMLRRGYEPFVTRYKIYRGRRPAWDYANKDFRDLFDHNKTRHQTEKTTDDPT